MTGKEEMIKFNGKDIKVVVFDLDGTLYELGFKVKFQFFMKNLKRWGLFHAHREVQDELRGQDLSSGKEFYDIYLENIAKKAGMDVVNVEDWYFNRFEDSFSEIIAKAGKREHLLELFDHLRDNDVRIAVYTDYSFIEKRLDALNIDLQNFEMLISSELEGVLKPTARPLKKISETMNIPLENILMVGDNYDTDGKSAKLAGTEFCILSKEKEKHHCEWDVFLEKIGLKI